MRFVIGLAGTFLKWWGRELADMIPPTLRSLVSGVPRPYEVCFSRDVQSPQQRGRRIILPLHHAGGAASLRGQAELGSRLKGRAIDLVWPCEWALERRVELPAKTLSRAGQIADLDFARSTPIDRSTVIWRNLVQRENAGPFVRQIVVKRDDLAAAEHALKDQGATLRTIALDDPKTDLAPLVDQRAAAARPWRWWRRLELGSLLVIAASLGYVVLMPHLAREEDRARLKIERTALMIEAETLTGAVDAAAATTQDRLALHAALLSRPQTAALLAELTAALPDDAWIQTLQIFEDRIAMTGASKGPAADLVIAITARGLFKEAALSGPVSFDATTGIERFQITARLAESGS